ncbi:hypothetical protein NIIDNTM18_42660 [Mycolicibacterium litorale]|uniref:Uncharacterized protein n=1 Tax=Mycolicibacterium litorale TaxID=758802 RepID=A0A6S6PG78_9MYCO|nr:hypothetical protein NIIDNTM18_42660 [Mycolicibacterium litorale]
MGSHYVIEKVPDYIRRVDDRLFEAGGGRGGAIDVLAEVYHCVRDVLKSGFSARESWVGIRSFRCENFRLADEGFSFIHSCFSLPSRLW